MKKKKLKKPTPKFKVGDEVFINSKKTLGGFLVSACMIEYVPYGAPYYGYFIIESPGHYCVQYKVDGELYRESELSKYTKEEHRLARIEYNIECLQKRKWWQR